MKTLILQTPFGVWFFLFGQATVKRMVNSGELDFSTRRNI